jgi:ferredoxin-like protein FixX
MELMGIIVVGITRAELDEKPPHHQKATTPEHARLCHAKLVTTTPACLYFHGHDPMCVVATTCSIAFHHVWQLLFVAIGCHLSET